jgi:hypothetical protein
VAILRKKVMRKNMPHPLALACSRQQVTFYIFDSQLSCPNRNREQLGFVVLLLLLKVERCCSFLVHTKRRTSAFVT